MVLIVLFLILKPVQFVYFTMGYNRGKVNE